MIYKNIIFKKENHIATIIINRPGVLNALNTETLEELDLIVNDFINDNNIYVVILTGEGKAFVAGADISELKNLDVLSSRKFSQLGNQVFRKLEKLDKPTIAAVNGFALGGGCELCMSCDIRIASSNAKFAQPEVSLGIVPGFGGTQRLSRLVGIGMAKQLIYTGDIIGSAEALRIGLVNRVVEPEQLLNEAIVIAEKIVKNAPIAVKLAKTAIDNGLQMNIDTALMYESEIFAECFSTQDQKSGMKAFLEKTKRIFNNK